MFIFLNFQKKVHKGVPLFYKSSYFCLPNPSQFRHLCKFSSQSISPLWVHSLSPVAFQASVRWAAAGSTRVCIGTIHPRPKSSTYSKWQPKSHLYHLPQLQDLLEQGPFKLALSPCREAHTGELKNQQGMIRFYCFCFSCIYCFYCQFVSCQSFILSWVAIAMFEVKNNKIKYLLTPDHVVTALR